MKRRFMKCMGIMTAVCISLSMPVSALADEPAGLDNTGELESTSSGVSEKAEDYAVYNVEKDTTVNHSGDINTDKKGVLADNGATVNQNGDIESNGTSIRAKDSSTINVNGDVSLNDDKSNDYKNAVYASDGSSVKINGNVNSEEYGVCSDDSEIVVNGRVSSEKTALMAGGKNASIRIEKGVEVYNDDESRDLIGISVGEGGNTTIIGDVGVSAVASENEAIATAVSVSGGTINIDGNVYSSANGSNAMSYGISADADSYVGNASVNVTGDILAKAESIETKSTNDSYAESYGISLYSSDGMTTSVIVDGNISATAKSAESNSESDLYAVGIEAGAEKNSLVNVTVLGDVSGSTEGIRISGNDGEVNIIVDGTISGKETAIFDEVITKYTKKNDPTTGIVTKGESGDLNLTVWQIKSDSGDLVKAEHRDRTKVEGKTIKTELKEREEEILKSINYIIRTDKAENGTITLSGTTLVGGYDTAHESQEVVIKVETASGYKLDAVKNGSSTLTKNADGTYTLIVPRGGGVQLSAVLSAIKQSNGSSSGGGSGGGGGSGSFSGQAGGNNGTTTQSSSGATVTTVSTEANGVKTSTATVSIDGKTATVETTVTVQDGKETSLRYVSGDISGVTFNGVGTVSSDGTKVTTSDGQVYSVTNAPMLLVTENGKTKGCFYNTETNSPITTGDMSVFYQLGEDGQLHAHWVGSNGYFYTGLVYIAGHMFTFDNEGIMLGVE